MSLAFLPPELLLLIITTLRQRDINALVRTCRKFHAILNPHLYRQLLLPGSKSNRRAHAAKCRQPENYDFLRTFRRRWLERESKEGHGHIALVYAAQTNQPKSIDHVVAAASRFNLSLDPDGRDPQFRLTPLDWAAVFGHVHIAETLLGLGATVRGRDQSSSLAFAVENGHVAMVELLLRHGAPSGSTDKLQRQTVPLMCAARPSQCWQAVPLKLNGKLDASQWPCENSQSNQAGPPRPQGSEKRLRRRKKMKGKRLIAVQFGGPKGSRDPADGPVVPPGMPWCAGSAYETILDLLLQYGADLEDQGSLNKTALAQAAENGFTPIVKALLDRGASPHPVYDVQNPQRPRMLRRWSLCCAVQGGHLDVVQLLLERGADRDLGDLDCIESGLSPLTCAADRDREAILRALLAALDKKSELPRPTGNWLPLVWASSDGHASMVRLLLDAEARYWPNARPSHATALWNATLDGREEVIALLLDAGVDFQEVHRRAPDDPQGTLSCLHSAVMSKHYGTVARMLAWPGLDVNQRDQHGLTALAVAARQKDEALVQLLLEHGADPAFQHVSGPVPRRGARPILTGIESSFSVPVACAFRPLNHQP
ncbi:ankyrin repeat domain-containing protein [Aspergillus fijiensis CBS 313.89]|uniref:Ankyrin n=1 Tax=Aspergillus fijiensis CBS 313.89 TaxID=1448319 RepID=A0A8G1RUU3_9EURO|nr:ankyrin [Aspergillus fijiensis CBS 313.89]RAK79318.1 ankyrin [Aspergillus fijiensis CBS 313.89]